MDCDHWAVGHDLFLLQREPLKLVAVALAYKTARTGIVRLTWQKGRGKILAPHEPQIESLSPRPVRGFSSSPQVIRLVVMLSPSKDVTEPCRFARCTGVVIDSAERGVDAPRYSGRGSQAVGRLRSAHLAILNRSEKEWRMPPREWTMAKASSPLSSANASSGPWRRNVQPPAHPRKS